MTRCPVCGETALEPASLCIPRLVGIAEQGTTTFTEYYGERPNPDHYQPFTTDEATWFQLWETVTKHALSVGVVERPVRSMDPDGGAWVMFPTGPSYGVHISRKHHHASREAAIAHADELRIAEINRLKRQIAKLEEMKF